MSTTMTLRSSPVRRKRAGLNTIQHVLMIAVLLLVFGVVNFVPASSGPAAGQLPSAAAAGPAVLPEPSGLAAEVRPAVVQPSPVPAAPALSPRMQGALDYVKRRYKVAPEALVPVFEVAQFVGQEMRIDPLLIVAIIGIESGFNPFAESTMGARGLMQVIPRFHRDKVPAGAGDGLLLDPVINIRVGVQVLDEAIRRGGGLVAGLQQYAGSSEPKGLYANKVLAEKERLEQAARRNRALNPALGDA